MKHQIQLPQFRFNTSSSGSPSVTDPAINQGWNVKLSRREMLALGAGATTALSLPGIAHADNPSTDADVLAMSISERLFANDGLARPVPTIPTPSDLASGLDRALALNLLDPNEIGPALKAGYDRAATEAPKIREFFG